MGFAELRPDFQHSFTRKWSLELDGSLSLTHFVSTGVDWYGDGTALMVGTGERLFVKSGITSGYYSQTSDVGMGEPMEYALVRWVAETGYRKRHSVSVAYVLDMIDDIAGDQYANKQGVRLRGALMFTPSLMGVLRVGTSVNAVESYSEGLCTSGLYGTVGERNSFSVAISGLARWYEPADAPGESGLAKRPDPITWLSLTALYCRTLTDRLSLNLTGACTYSSDGKVDIQVYRLTGSIEWRVGSM